jgi:uncharacterized membrane protein YkgB
MKIESLHAVEAALLRYGLALIFLWIGVMKFTAYEAAGIQPLKAAIIRALTPSP